MGKYCIDLNWKALCSQDSSHSCISVVSRPTGMNIVDLQQIHSIVYLLL